jgi:hypothetical protein
MARSDLAGGVWRHGGTDCDLLDLTDPASAWAGSQDEECGNRWLVVCPHGSLVSSPDEKMARWLAAHPREFCEDHR